MSDKQESKATDIKLLKDEMDACDQQLRIFRYMRNALTDDGIIPDSFSPQIMAIMIEYANKMLISHEIQASRDQRYSKPKAQESKQSDTGKQEEHSNWDDVPATEGQKKALFVITHSKDGNGKWTENDKYKQLPRKIEEMTKQEASDFIDKYGEKREG